MGRPDPAAALVAALIAWSTPVIAEDVQVASGQASASPGITELVSVRRLPSSTANDNSFGGTLSADGRYVAYSSIATDLVSDDTNRIFDIFVTHLQSGRAERVSVSSRGTPANAHSFGTALSADGRYVAFLSDATNLVRNDTNAQPDVFVHDRQTHETRRASVSSSGEQGFSQSFEPSISADGRYVVFSSISRLVPNDSPSEDVFLHDRATGTTSLLSAPPSGTPEFESSTEPVISANGRFVAFASGARNLVPGDTNTQSDVFVRDLQTGTITRVSVNAQGVEGNHISENPAISADGRFVAFESRAFNLAPGDQFSELPRILVVDRQTGSVRRADVTPTLSLFGRANLQPAISADGRFVSFTSQVDRLFPQLGAEIWVSDLATMTLSRASLADDEALPNALSGASSMSADGRRISFFSPASNLVAGDANVRNDVFVRDRDASTTVAASAPHEPSLIGRGEPWRDCSLTKTGRYVVFSSDDPNLVEGDTNAASDIFVRDLQTQFTTRVSVDSNGQQANGNSHFACIVPYGRYVTFVSEATNLVSDDFEGFPDVFLHDRHTGLTTRVSVNSSGTGGLGDNAVSSVAAGGQFVVFTSTAANLVEGDTNGVADVFVRDTVNRTTRRISVSSNGAQANDASFDPSITLDARLVAFSSRATNLAPGDTDTSFDVYVHNLRRNETTLVTVNAGDADHRVPSLTEEGRYVAYRSSAITAPAPGQPEVSDVFVRDMQLGRTRRVSIPLSGTTTHVTDLAINDDGRYIAFTAFGSNVVRGDTNRVNDIFLRDMVRGHTVRVSVSTEGAQSDGISGLPSIDSSGRHIVFTSSPTTFSDEPADPERGAVYVRHLVDQDDGLRNMK